MTISPKDLTGDARKWFDTWRNLGLSESAAMDQVRRDGYLGQVEDGFDRVAQNLGRAFGLSESAARTAAAGHATEREARLSARRAAAAPSNAELTRLEQESRRSRDEYAARLEETRRREAAFRLELAAAEFRERGRATADSVRRLREDLAQLSDAECVVLAEGIAPDTFVPGSKLSARDRLMRVVIDERRS